MPESIILVLAVALAATLFLLARFGQQLSIAKARVAILTTAVGTIAGSCYRHAEGKTFRIDQNASPAGWPADLAELTPSLPVSIRRLLLDDLARLEADGRSFVLQTICTWRQDQGATSRLIEISGYRVLRSATTPIVFGQASAGGAPDDDAAHVDLVWVADITDRASIAEEITRIAAEKEFLTEILEHLPLTIWWRAQDLTLTGGNRALGDLERYAAAGQPSAEALRDDPAGEHIDFVASLRGEPPNLVDLRERRLPSGVIAGFALDRGVIEALRQELARLILAHREVLESISTAIAIYGPDTRLLFHNTAFEVLWGLSREFLVAEPTLATLLDSLRNNRILPEYVDYRKFRADQTALFTDISTPIEDLMHLPDGRTLRARTARHPFGGLTFIYEDVTGSLDMERNYNTLIAVQRETIDNLSEGIAVFGSDGRLKLWNPAFAACWGQDPQSLDVRLHISALVDAARSSYERVAPDDTPWDVLRARIIGQITSYTACSDRLERHDGRVYEVRGVPLPDGNMLMTYQDTTDSMRVQRAMEDRFQALQDAANLKNEFLANVSYELRTPLNAVIGFGEILTNQFFGPLNERQMEYGHGILEGSHRLLALINDVLDLATIESRRMKLDFKPVDMHTLLVGVVNATQERIDTSRLTLIFECPPGIGSIVADDRRLRQILFNLISNAIKFTPGDGTISLIADRQEDGVNITITDTGIGIPVEDQARVFEKFERGRKRNHQVGPGLGLPLARSFVELHGGRIDMQSTPGIGTRIICYFPAQPPEVD